MDWYLYVGSKMMLTYIDTLVGLKLAIVLVKDDFRLRLTFDVELEVDVIAFDARLNRDRKFWRNGWHEWQV